MLVIGFATQFYTLWDVTSEDIYVTDAYGNRHLQRTIYRYHYHKNISFDLATAQAQYPDAKVDDELRGKSRDFSLESDSKLPVNLLQFGKYRMRTVEDVAELDFNYLLWVVDNTRSRALADYIRALPAVVAHFAKIEAAELATIAALPLVKSGDVIEVLILHNPNHRVGCYGESPIDHFYYDSPMPAEFSEKWHLQGYLAGNEDHRVHILIDEVVAVGGIYPYNKAVIDGKAAKTKNITKSIRVNVIGELRSIGGLSLLVSII